MASLADIAAYHALNPSGIFDLTQINYLTSQGLVPPPHGSLFTGSNLSGFTGIATMPAGDNFPRKGYVQYAGSYSSVWPCITPNTSYVGGAVIVGGALYTWGGTSFSANFRGAPGALTRVGTDSDWKKFRSSYCGLALKTSGTLWSCGYNPSGQAGRGTTATSVTLGQIGSDADWNDFEHSIDHTIAIKNNGTLWSWGSNSNGRTGLNTTTGNTTSPAQVGSGTDWLGAWLWPGLTTTHIVKSDGTMWVCGSNANGVLGLNTTTGNQITLAQSGTDTNWRKVWSTTNSAYALKSDGTMWYSTSYTTQNNQPASNVWRALAPGTTWTDCVPNLTSTGAYLLNAAGELWYFGFNNPINNTGNTNLTKIFNVPAGTQVGGASYAMNVWY